VTVGVLLAGALNIPLASWADGWRLSYSANAAFSAALAALMIAGMPESPRWLAGKGRDAAAKEALGRVRFPHEVCTEIQIEHGLNIFEQCGLCHCAKLLHEKGYFGTTFLETHVCFIRLDKLYSFWNYCLGYFQVSKP
jgi:hypothetical protein